MIAKLIVYKCRNCDSQNIVKNGHNASGSQQYVCKDCGKRGVLEPKRGYREAQKEQILSAYHEHSSMRGVRETAPRTRTTVWRGHYAEDPSLRAEFFTACGLQRNEK